MNVSLFGDSWDNVTLHSEIMDANNVTYPSETTLWLGDGYHGISTLAVRGTRLQANQNYSVKVWTEYENVTSYPFTRQVTLGKAKLKFPTCGRNGLHLPSVRKRVFAGRIYVVL